MFASAPFHSKSSTKIWSQAFKGPAKVTAFALATNSFVHRPSAAFSSFNGSQQATTLSQVVPKLTIWSALRGISLSTSACRAEQNDAVSSGTSITADEVVRIQEAASKASTSGESSDSLQASSPVSSGNGTQSQTSSQLVFKAAAAMIPHPEKAYRGGEDAYFIGDDGLSLGVADGVGGWAEVNVDPGIYSRLLMRNCKQFAKELPASEDRTKDILVKAHGQTDQKGSSTACVITLEGAKLKAANVGDSGFMVMRKDKIVMRSPAQQHQFNFPFQIGGPDCGSDPPESAESFAFDLQRGDVVVLATDGVTDNVFPEEAAAIVSVIQRKGETSQVAATGLANYASMRAESKTHMTPFAVGAQQAGFFFQGGKMDDITVLVAYVTEATSL